MRGLVAKHRVYKPNVDAQRTLEVESGFAPQQTLMVTANPTFGDLEGAAAIGIAITDDPPRLPEHGGAIALCWGTRWGHSTLLGESILQNLVDGA